MKALFGLFLLGTILSFSSCYTGRPLTQAPSQNNRTYEVSYLFEHDGCKVYRFYDMGNYVYFSNCKGNVTAISSDSARSRVHTIVNNELSIKE
jgi:hypothetical protein